MKKLLKKLNTKHEGATLITVVIATAFLIAIGVVILSASTRYLVSVYMDRNSNDNLYDAEGILAEVRTGILEYAGEAGAAAYKDIVENYEKVYKDELGMPLSAKDRFARRYICGIIQQLEGGTLIDGITKEWDNTIVNDTSVMGTDISEDDLHQKSFSVDNIRCLTNYPDAVKTKAMLTSPIAGGTPTATPTATPESTGTPTSSDLKYAIYKSPTKGYFLTIRNLVIDYTSPSDYRSTIQTDIQLMVPDYKFDGSDTLDAASKFLIVSDGKLEVGGSAERSDGESATDGATFNGSIYTGGKVESTASLDNAGINVLGNKAAHFNCEMLISRGSLDAYTGSKVDIHGANEVSVVGGVPVSNQSTAGDIYLKNIRLLGNGTGVGGTDFRGTDFSMKANAYIENDLDIRDAGSTVTLGGQYYGYSYSKENEYNPASAKSQSDYSSAILVNGIGTCLQSDPSTPLSKLLLAGRTYVSRGENKVTDAYNDIMMGESVAVKSNQIAYLVPDKYVLVKHNPISASESSDEGGSYFEPTTLVDIDAMKEDTDLWQYLDEGRPVTGNYGQATVQTGDEGYVFLYLNFKDQISANKYFKDFFSGKFNVADPEEEEDDDTPGMVTVDDLTQRARAYITTKDAAMKFSPEMYLIAGNIVHNYEADGGPGFQEASYFDQDGNPSETLLDDGKKVGLRYVNLQKYLTTSGDASSMRLMSSGKTFIDPTTKQMGTASSETADPLVSTQIINPDEITAERAIGIDQNLIEPQTGAKVYSGISGTNTLSVNSISYLNSPQGGTGYGRCLIVNKGNVEIGIDCAGLIVADGNVTVNANFRGLIIATGDVNVLNTVTMESDVVLVNKLFTYAQSDPRLAPIFKMSIPETHNTTIQEDCCRYLNWVKNTY